MACSREKGLYPPFPLSWKYNIFEYLTIQSHTLANGYKENLVMLKKKWSGFIIHIVAELALTKILRFVRHYQSGTLRVHYIASYLNILRHTTSLSITQFYGSCLLYVAIVKHWTLLIIRVNWFDQIGYTRRIS